MGRRIKFQDIKYSDLYRNAFYLTDRTNENNNDPLSEIFDCGDTGIFRYVGSTNLVPVYIAILCYKKNESEFPSNIDKNLVLNFLNNCFKDVNLEKRKSIPPFFIFTTGISGPRGLDVLFRGVAVPGDQNQPPDRETHLIWSSKTVEKYLNQKVVFTVLDIDEVKRTWLEDLGNGKPLSDACPEPWRRWVETGECISHRESKTKRYTRYILHAIGFGDHIGGD